jgi:hypothetical protein
MTSYHEVKRIIDRIKPNGVLQTQIVEALYGLLELKTNNGYIVPDTIQPAAVPPSFKMPETISTPDPRNNPNLVPSAIDELIAKVKEK